MAANLDAAFRLLILAFTYARSEAIAERTARETCHSDVLTVNAPASIWRASFPRTVSFLMPLLVRLRFSVKRALFYQ
jgi:hypothetical protein